MKNNNRTNQQTSQVGHHRRTTRILFGAAVTLLAVSFAAFSSFWQNGSQAAEFFPAHDESPVFQNWGRFSHSVGAHAQRSCDSCHQRPDNSAIPRFAGHSSCIDCHLGQFTTPEIPMCLICHSDPNPPAPMRAFPTKFNERFNMKFNHAAHNRGAGRPAEGCAACHKPLRGGVALSIPISISSHNQCYTCHTANSNIGSCSVCHSLAGYRRTPTTGVAFRANFSHGDHGRRQNLGCADCHTVRAGAPQSRQVSSPVTTQHFASSRATSCMTCHNDKRAFGDRDFANCKRCHTGATFDMIR